MKNIDRLARYVTKNGAESFLIHSIPGTGNWVIAQKIEKDKWALTLGNPMGNVTYNLGTVTNDQHLALWMEIVNMEIEKKASQARLANELKDKVYKFIKKYESTYKKFIKLLKEKTKQKRPQYRRRNARSKKTSR